MKFKQIFIVNKNLHMGIGKCCSQCLHGEVLYLEDIINHYTDLEQDEQVEFIQRYEKWRGYEVAPIGLQTKIVLKATELEMLNLIDTCELQCIKYYQVFDLGKTQIEKGSFTVLVLEPLDDVKCSSLVGSLKLL